MFCKACGTKLNDDAAFCSNCGTPAGELPQAIAKNKANSNVEEDNIVKLEVRPTFIWGDQIIKTIIWMLIVLLLISYGVAWAFFAYPVFGYIILAIVVIVGIVLLFFKKVQYNSISYKFYKTKIEYVDGFLSKMEKEVKYEYIREVNMSQNVLERMFGLGKIQIYTSASGGYINGGHGQSGRNGINIHCVKEVREVLAKIKSIIEENSVED